MTQNIQNAEGQEHIIRMVKLSEESEAIGDRLMHYYALVARGIRRGKSISREYAKRQCKEAFEGRYSYLL